jgi:metal-responsive CopG/Arc/MetJ family transcriptional regulator
MRTRSEQHQTTVRFTEQDLALLDAIQEKTGIVSRTEILRRAIRMLAEHEKVATSRRSVVRPRGR